jgi:hypothetical protein
MPGKIIQCLKQLGTSNPVILIDGMHLSNHLISLFHIPSHSLSLSHTQKFVNYRIEFYFLTDIPYLFKKSINWVEVCGAILLQLS